MEFMKPISSTEIPHGDDWLYEVKFDGFRCRLSWHKNGNIRLTSRNNNDMTEKFPEIVGFCQDNQSAMESFLPLTLDGELVVLNNAYQANFSWIQKRSRLRKDDTIQRAAEKRPASLMTFDILEGKGNDLTEKRLMERKKILMEVSEALGANPRLYLVEAYPNPDELWLQIFDHKGEGMIAKRKTSKYQSAKKHRDWFKIKNWRTIQGFLTEYDTKNGYFSVQVFADNSVHEAGKCKHGLGDESLETLKQLFFEKGEKTSKGYKLPPAICASIHTLDLYKEELREPAFANLLPNVHAEDCTLRQLQLDLAMIPEQVDISKTDKLYWPDQSFTKGDLLIYIREIAPYMLPFLEQRALTLIRCPEGVEGESFFQKNLPDYAPAFIDSMSLDDEEKIICNRLESLVWFANHGTLEYHVPFQTAGSTNPIEIVFDLDPPSREEFQLAIQAATLIKGILDDLQLASFVKTSGNKGIQIHIPIPEDSLTYDDTAIFTQAVAFTVENAYPSLFTTERVKKKRGDRLYIDYVQHGKDKTIIAPYSPRMTKDGTVAAPLYWEEVNDQIHPEQFTIQNVADRVKEMGCPFSNYRKAGNTQNVDKILKMIK